MMLRSLSVSVRSSLHSKRCQSTSTRPAIAHTLYSPSPESLTTYLSAHPPSPTAPTVYLLSTSIPQHVLVPLLTTLQSIPNSVGSFSISSPDDAPTLSIASFPGAKTWWSGITGRPAAEVGKFQRPSPGGRLWEEDLKGTQKGEIDNILSGQRDTWADAWKVGHTAERVDTLEGVQAERLLFLTDGNPSPLLGALKAMMPAASVLGMITAPTPFVTSRPHTLFHNHSTYSNGAVGLAIPNPARTAVEYNLEPLTDEFGVIAAQGNMLIQIDSPNPNPTQMLITALQARGLKLTKEEEFYLSIEKERGERRVVRILSGDPSRGALALETEVPLAMGQTFLQRSPTGVLSRPTPGRFAFSIVERTDQESEHLDKGSSVVEGFVGYSEDGFTSGGEMCKVPWATGSWYL